MPKKNHLDLLTKIKETIRIFKLLKSNDRVLIGFSTGPDSVALLKVMVELGFKPGLCYVDHGQRPVKGEIELTKQYSEQFKLKYYIREIESEVSTESAMRKERYHILHQLSQEEKYDKIALAHTLSDQLETIIINLTRGSTRIRPIPPRRDNIVRPLIEIPREEIINYLKKIGLSYSIDLSNEALDHTRNIIRHRIIPVLKELNPGIYTQLERNIQIWLEEDHYLDSLLPDFVEEDFDIKLLQNYNQSMQRRAIVKWFRQNSGLPINSRQVADIIALAQGQSGKKIEIKDGTGVVKEFDHLHLSEEAPVRFSYELPLPGELVLEKGRIISRITKKRPANFTKNSAFFDIDKLDPPLVIRNWVHGDYIVSFGMEGKKKLKQIWNECKIPGHLRKHIPILTDQKDILWIAGVKRATKAPISDQTSQILKVTYER